MVFSNKVIVASLNDSSESIAGFTVSGLTFFVFTLAHFLLFLPFYFLTYTKYREHKRSLNLDVQIPVGIAVLRFMEPEEEDFKNCPFIYVCCCCRCVHPRHQGLLVKANGPISLNFYNIYILEIHEKMFGTIYKMLLPPFQ